MLPVEGRVWAQRQEAPAQIPAANDTHRKRGAIGVSTLCLQLYRTLPRPNEASTIEAARIDVTVFP